MSTGVGLFVDSKVLLKLYVIETEFIVFRLIKMLFRACGRVRLSNCSATKLLRTQHSLSSRSNRAVPRAVAFPKQHSKLVECRSTFACTAQAGVR